MKKYIDTHAHVFKDTYKDKLDEIISESLKEIKVIINIGYDIETIKEVLVINKKHKELIPVIGIHPTEFNFKRKDEITQILSEIESLLIKNSSKIIAVGEIGLDFYHDINFKKQQILGLEFQIELARKIKKPIIIHARESIDEMYYFVKKNSDIKFLIHSWSGDIEQTKKYNSLKNVYFGINGIITFKNSNLKENLNFMDLEKILLETDSPWLSPVPFRGKVNKPNNVKYVYEFLIKELNFIEKDFLKLIDENYINFFGEENEIWE